MSAISSLCRVLIHYSCRPIWFMQNSTTSTSNIKLLMCIEIKISDKNLYFLCSITNVDVTCIYYCIYNLHGHTKRKRKRSDSVLWQKPLHQQKCQKGKVTTQTTPQKSSIKQRLRTDTKFTINVFCHCWSYFIFYMYTYYTILSILNQQIIPFPRLNRVLVNVTVDFICIGLVEL